MTEAPSHNHKKKLGGGWARKGGKTIKVTEGYYNAGILTTHHLYSTANTRKRQIKRSQRPFS